MDMKNYDMIIIGTGAGGGTLAYSLASTGKRILLVERGDFLPREKENWEPSAVFLENRYKTKEVWKDKNDQDIHPGTHYCVGGNTKVYGSALLRFREKDFEELEHKGGISPAWPLKYRDFQPYYLQAEKLYKVHGQRGADPLDPPEDTPFPRPAVSHEPRIQFIADKMKEAGLKPFHLPLGINLNESDRESSSCIRCDTCDGFPCLVDAKSDAEVVCIKPALEHPNVTLLTNAKAVCLKTDPTGRHVTILEVEREGEIEQYSAGIFILACGAINSAALLLRSKNDKHPNGLANSSGLVGRNYMCHTNSAMVALSVNPNRTHFQKTLGLNDFYFGSDDWNYPMGHIQLLGNVKKDMLKAGAPPFTPSIALEAMANHAIGWWLSSEDLPDPNNRVTLDSNGEIVLHYTPNNEEGHKRLVKKLKSIISSIEPSLFLSTRIPIGGVGHQVGTCRFGLDPKNSVLDINCKTHDVDNLYVVDGSFFPSSAAINPGLTIIANALRVADVLRKG
jgi:choline dehydrogenase-like flavoprotein